MVPKPTAELAFLCRALKAPSLAAAAGRLAERARAESWTHEEYLAACLDREVAARQSHGGEARIRAARFPARKTIEEFDFDHQRSLRREVIAHLGALDFVEARQNVVFLGPRVPAATPRKKVGRPLKSRANGETSPPTNPGGAV
jgi:DNA replication protein DnaC